MSKVSILVAVYNARPFLPKCLDSLLGQTHRDLQIICVDDASTDGSIDVLRAYAAKDARVMVLLQTQNLGQAVARNRALELATGEFVAMVDSDDWLAPDALERALQVFRHHPQADAVLFDLCYHDEQTGEETPYPLRADKHVFSGYEAFELSLDWRIHGLYLLRTSLHREHPFDTSCRLFSDDNTSHIHFLHSREVRLGGGTYFYRRHAASMTNAISMRRFDYMEANLSLRRQLLSAGVKREAVTFYEGHRWLNFIGTYYLYYMHRAEFDVPQRREILRRMRAILSTFRRGEVPLRVRWKPGYWLLRPFALFRLQEEVYFFLRACFGRNKTD